MKQFHFYNELTPFNQKLVLNRVEAISKTYAKQIDLAIDDWHYVYFKVYPDYDIHHPQDSPLLCHTCQRHVKYLYFCRNNLGQEFGFGETHVMDALSLTKDDVKQFHKLRNEMFRQIEAKSCYILKRISEQKYWLKLASRFPEINTAGLQEKNDQQMMWPEKDFKELKKQVELKQQQVAIRQQYQDKQQHANNKQKLPKKTIKVLPDSQFWSNDYHPYLYSVHKDMQNFEEGEILYKDHQVPIYAEADGYLRKIYNDCGSDLDIINTCYRLVMDRTDLQNATWAKNPISKIIIYQMFNYGRSVCLSRIMKTPAETISKCKKMIKSNHAAQEIYYENRTEKVIGFKFTQLVEQIYRDFEQHDLVFQNSNLWYMSQIDAV